VISPATFAAVIPGQAAMASVDGDLLNGIANRTGTVPHPVTGAPVKADIPASNEHLAWGFFLGTWPRRPRVRSRTTSISASGSLAVWFLLV
jgi:hypothetical protein